MQKVIEIINGVARHPQFRMAEPLNFELLKGEQLAICGPNGSGKSILASLLTGERPLLSPATLPPGGKIRHVTFRDKDGTSAPPYYQQRWNQWDNTEYPTARETLRQLSAEETLPAHIAEALLADSFLEKRINLLSSGEWRKLQLLKATISRPDLLIIDNPYIGLDAEARTTLTELLESLTPSTTLILIVSRPADIPPFITHAVHVSDRQVRPKQPLAQYLRQEAASQPPVITLPVDLLTSLAASSQDPEAEEVIRLRDVRISYGGRPILDGINWTVRKGEHWAISGPNGAGKTTLLSLILADNPMAYACDISLFGHKRGDGESIWDIKRHIGHVSPELHRSYRKPQPALDIVCSGFHDATGAIRRPTPLQQSAALGWMRLLGIEDLAPRTYTTLSEGQQRLVLLARAFVKSPALLVLDEPLHGLDDAGRCLAIALIDAYAALPGKTLLYVSHYKEEHPACIRHVLTLKRNGYDAGKAQETEQQKHHQP